MIAGINILAGFARFLIGSGIVVWAIVTGVILFAYARTRLYPLYVLKVCWVGLTIVGFIWLISMSFADPGPKHGGEQQEYMQNPAGPFAALADVPDLTRKTYGMNPWWIVAGLTLMALWRGLSGHRWADRDSEMKSVIRKVFLGLSGLGAVVLVSLADAESDAFGQSHAGAGLLLIGCAGWALAPTALKRRLCLPVLGLLGALLLVPVIRAFAAFDWSGYTYVTGNYAYAWKTAHMGKYMLNSVLVSLMTVGITTLCASMAAYGLTRFEYCGRNLVLFGFIGAMVIPAQLYIVPLFLMVQKWQVTIGGMHFSFMDSRLGLSLIYAAAGLPFATFLLTGFYRTLPGTLREAAAIDGCGEWRVYTDVYFPLAAPGMATAAIFQFIGVWNEYQFALVFLTNDKLKTLPVGLYNLSVGQQYAANWSALFAGVTILCLPTFLIFVILQERIVAGLTVGAVKE